MSKQIKHTLSDHKGSFVAGGSSLRYEYCASENLLKVVLNSEKKLLRTVTMPVRSLCNPLQFVHYFDKIAKIKALNFSNDTTVNITYALQGDKLLTVLSNVEHLTRYCMMMQEECFKNFCRSFCQNNALGHMIIKPVPRERDLMFFSASITSLNDEMVEATGDSLHSILRELSKNVIQQLVMSECSYSHHNSAQNLLSVSATLSILARATNENFIPEFQLTVESQDSEAIEA